MRREVSIVMENSEESNLNYYQGLSQHFSLNIILSVQNLSYSCVLSDVDKIVGICLLHLRGFG